MVVTISHNGYIKRTPASTYRAQHRGGKGMNGAKTEEEDPIEHLFVASTHDYLLFFTNRGKVYWQKVYDLPQLSRDSRGRAVVNLLNFAEGEKDRRLPGGPRFHRPDHYLMMATRKGLVKKTPLEAYSRPMKGRHHRHQAQGRRRAGRRRDHQAGRRSRALDRHGHGDPLQRGRRPADGPQHQRREGHQARRRTIGWSAWSWPIPRPRCSPPAPTATASGRCSARTARSTATQPAPETERPAEERRSTKPTIDEPTPRRGRRGSDGEATPRVSSRYRTQRRGGKGLRDIKTTERNGPVIGIVARRATTTSC